jgi:hypothetical protein
VAAPLEVAEEVSEQLDGSDLRGIVRRLAEAVRELARVVEGHRAMLDRLVEAEARALEARTVAWTAAGVLLRARASQAVLLLLGLAAVAALLRAAGLPVETLVHLAGAAGL